MNGGGAPADSGDSGGSSCGLRLPLELCEARLRLLERLAAGGFGGDYID